MVELEPNTTIILSATKISPTRNIFTKMMWLVLGCKTTGSWASQIYEDVGDLCPYIDDVLGGVASEMEKLPQKEGIYKLELYGSLASYPATLEEPAEEYIEYTVLRYTKVADYEKLFDGKEVE